MKPLDAQTTKPLEGGSTYSLGNRLTRALWAVSWMLLASWTPAPMHSWRRALLRLFGAKLHGTAHVYGTAKIWFPGNLIMDAHSCLGPRVNCYNMATIHLRSGAIVSQGTHLCAGTHDIDDPHFQLITKPITVGTKAWVAADTFVGPGVSIGPRAVIGARAVLFKDAVENGIYAGNPARLLRTRTPNAVEGS